MSKENNLSKPEYINLDLLVLTDTMKRLLGSITSLAIFEPSSQQFEPKGLFSTDIFGLLVANKECVPSAILI